MAPRWTRTSTRRSDVLQVGLNMHSPLGRDDGAVMEFPRPATSGLLGRLLQPPPPGRFLGHRRNLTDDGVDDLSTLLLNPGDIHRRDDPAIRIERDRASWRFDLPGTFAHGPDDRLAIPEIALLQLNPFHDHLGAVYPVSLYRLGAAPYAAS